MSTIQEVMAVEATSTAAHLRSDVATIAALTAADTVKILADPVQPLCL